MAELRSMVDKVRSKNAGPFWLTIDIFCGTPDQYKIVAARLSTDQIASVFDVRTNQIKRFDIADLHVVKFSLPRPQTQGAIDDRDMHGASWAALIGELEI